MTSDAMRTEIAIREETSAVMLTNAQLQMIANTSFVPVAFRGKVPEVLACVATGRALGLPDMTSLRGINVIEGKATLSAELMVAIVRGHGHSITGTVGETAATVRGKRADNGDEMEATFTLTMAAAAGLTNKQNWKRHADDMLWARAVSRLCRRLFADCFAGATYVPEEIEQTADELMDVSPPVDIFVSDEQIAEVVADEAFPEARVRRDDPAESQRSESPLESPASESAYRDFVAWVKEQGISREQGDAAMADLFPGRKASDLNPDEVGRLRAALEGVLA